MLVFILKYCIVQILNRKTNELKWLMITIVIVEINLNVSFIKFNNNKTVLNKTHVKLFNFSCVIITISLQYYNNLECFLGIKSVSSANILL